MNKRRSFGSGAKLSAAERETVPRERELKERV